MIYLGSCTCTVTSTLVCRSGDHEFDLALRQTQDKTKLIWALRLTQFKLGAQKRAWEVKSADVILITSLIKC